jgi:hypothetical protein
VLGLILFIIGRYLSLGCSDVLERRVDPWEPVPKLERRCVDTGASWTTARALDRLHRCSSARRACTLFSVARSALSYQPKSSDVLKGEAPAWLHVLWLPGLIGMLWRSISFSSASRYAPTSSPPRCSLRASSFDSVIVSSLSFIR